MPQKTSLYEIFHVSYRDVNSLRGTTLFHDNRHALISTNMPVPYNGGFRLHLHNISAFRLAAPRLVHCYPSTVSHQPTAL